MDGPVYHPQPGIIEQRCRRRQHVAESAGQYLHTNGCTLLKRWIVFPLKDIQKINERLDVVEYLILQTDLRNKLMHAMRQCGDVERLVSKIPLKKINPRELLQLARALTADRRD